MCKPKSLETIKLNVQLESNKDKWSSVGYPVLYIKYIGVCAQEAKHVYIWLQNPVNILSVLLKNYWPKTSILDKKKYRDACLEKRFWN